MPKTKAKHMHGAKLAVAALGAVPKEVCPTVVSIIHVRLILEHKSAQTFQAGEICRVNAKPRGQRLRWSIVLWTRQTVCGRS